MYQLSSRANIRPLISASIIAFTPFIYTVLLRAIHQVAPSNLLHWRDILTLILQLTVATFVFYKLDYDDSYVTWIVWGAAGLIVISMIIPIVVYTILSI